MFVVKSKIIDKGYKIRIEDLPTLAEDEKIEPIFNRV